MKGEIGRPEPINTALPTLHPPACWKQNHQTTPTEQQPNPRPQDKLLGSKTVRYVVVDWN